MTAPIGILALQGDFREHAASVQALGVETRPIRTPRELEAPDLEGLIIPGGESTTIARLLLSSGLFEPLRALGERRFPIWGTCAGAILLADDARGLDRPALGLLPMTVERNAFGRQIDSFEADLPALALGPTPYHAVFIRAPRIRAVGEGVDVLMELHGEPVAVRYGALLATTFHPELTADRRLHAYFVQECVARARATAPVPEVRAG